MIPQTFIPDAADGRAFRNALGQFATGVCVITTVSDKGPLGITANSFASLSLDPALVLWSPARASRRFEAFEQASHYAIHVLGQEQLHLARHFAGEGLDFDLPGVTSGIEGLPLLSDALAIFECRQVATHPGGDHAIVVGEVLRVHQRQGAPLVFAGGAYGGFSDE